MSAPLLEQAEHVKLVLILCSNPLPVQEAARQRLILGQRTRGYLLAVPGKRSPYELTPNVIGDGLAHFGCAMHIPTKSVQREQKHADGPTSTSAKAYKAALDAAHTPNRAAQTREEHNCYSK